MPGPPGERYRSFGDLAAAVAPWKSAERDAFLGGLEKKAPDLFADWGAGLAELLLDDYVLGEGWKPSRSHPRDGLLMAEAWDLSEEGGAPWDDFRVTPWLEQGAALIRSDLATLKAVEISKQVEGMVLSDDSGLEVDALDGAPGVYSARYAGVHGDDAGNNAKLLNELVGVADRSARFRCVMVLAREGEALAHFDGAVEGKIISEQQGAGGFGYDPLFVPDGYEETFAELGEDVKNGLSHRARAMAQVVGWLSAEESGVE